MVYGEGQEEYIPLPALRFDDGTVVTCWKLSWKDLLYVVLHRKVWLSMLTFNKPLQPTLICTDHRELFKSENDE